MGTPSERGPHLESVRLMSYDSKWKVSVKVSLPLSASSTQPRALEYAPLPPTMGLRGLPSPLNAP